MKAIRMAPTDHQKVCANAAATGSATWGGNVPVVEMTPTLPPALAAAGPSSETIWRSSTTAKSAVATEPPTWRTMFIVVLAFGISAWLRSK